MAKISASRATTTLPSLAVTEPQQVVQALQDCAATEGASAIYPRGGGTMPHYGLPPVRPGSVLDLSGLNRVVDYPARDMTITVEAGITLARLAEVLARENQWLPVDVPCAARATLGGAMAVNASGPRRYGQGTLRDYVIGVSAVDGRGVPFKAGGRVVKNVAGYDLCKLLIGSLGTLAVITQATLKVKPRPAASALLACDVPNWQTAEWLLAALVQSAVTPTAIEVLAGPAWQSDAALGPAAAGTAARLVVGLEGTPEEVGWMTRALREEWQARRIDARIVAADLAAGLWSRLTEFSQPENALSADGPYVIKANVLPSEVTKFAAGLLDRVGGTSLQAHAGNGIVVAQLPGLAGGEAARVLIQQVQPLATAGGGNAVVLSYPAGAELTRAAVWGSAPAGIASMRAVKEQFDPHDVLNPGRFIY